MGKKGSILNTIVFVVSFLIVFYIGMTSDFEITHEYDDNQISEENTEVNTNIKIDAETENKEVIYNPNINIKNIPEYAGEPYVVINNNVPYFEEDEITSNSYEYFSELDVLGRCGVVHASIGKDLMPTDERENISNVKPTGWQISKYDWVDGLYLYNRCHLIGFQLTGENANEKNLITGTRYLNVQGMLPFENEVANYVRTTGNHVMYRVTPVFEENNFVASGVVMEALSVEDNGEGVKFNVFCYNVQPGVEIDYSTGMNHKVELDEAEINEETKDYIINKNSRKFHLPSCDGATQMSEKNKKEYTGYRSELIMQGYEPCGTCNP